MKSLIFVLLTVASVQAFTLDQVLSGQTAGGVITGVDYHDGMGLMPLPTTYGSKAFLRLSKYPRGRVELYKEGKWGTLCGHFWWNNQKGAENICKQLGYSGGTWYNAPGGNGPIQAGNRLCSGGEPTVWDCPLQDGRNDRTRCDHNRDIGVDCSTEKVRLSRYPRGRVELFKEGTWGTLCGHYWWDNQKGAENICKQLGYSGGTWYRSPGGTGPIQAGNRLCSGGEATVWDCPLQSGRNDLTRCDHDQDIGVDCS